MPARDHFPLRVTLDAWGLPPLNKRALLKTWGDAVQLVFPYFFANSYFANIFINKSISSGKIKIPPNTYEGCFFFFRKGVRISGSSREFGEGGEGKKERSKLLALQHVVHEVLLLRGHAHGVDAEQPGVLVLRVEPGKYKQQQRKRAVTRKKKGQRQKREESGRTS